MKRRIRRLLAVTAVLTLLCATTAFAQVYVDPATGIVSAQITKKAETMTVKNVPAGVPYALENNTDYALTIYINGVLSGALAPRSIDPTGEYYVADCVLVAHPLGTKDTIKVKNGVVNITQK